MKLTVTINYTNYTRDVRRCGSLVEARRHVQATWEERLRDPGGRWPVSYEIALETDTNLYYLNADCNAILCDYREMHGRTYPN